MYAIEKRLLRCRRFFDHSASLLWVGCLARLLAIAALATVA